MKNFIVIEGVDGSGKTTVGESLADRISGEYIFTPSRSYESIRDYINCSASPEARFLYYLSSVIDVSDKISKSGDKNYICVRYIWSTIIGYAVIGDKDVSDVKRMLKPFEPYIIRPTKNVLLTVSEDEQIKRLKLRNGCKHTFSDKLSIESEEFRNKVNRMYHEFAYKNDSWAIIDTTNKSIENVVDEVFEKCGLESENWTKNGYNKTKYLL